MDTTHKIGVIVSAGQTAVNNAVLGRGGMDKLTSAHIDTSVRAGLTGVAAGIIEEHQIAGLQLTDAGYAGTNAALPLAGGGMGQGITQLLVDMHSEAGAIKATGRRAAVNVTGSQILLGKLSSAAGRAVGRGQVQEITANIAFCAVFASNLVPTILEAIDGDDGAAVRRRYCNY